MYQSSNQFTDPQSLYQNQFQGIDIPEQTYVFERLQPNLPQQQQQESDFRIYPQRRKAHTDLKGAPKKKKSRNQLNRLIEAFKTNHKPNRAEIISLSEQTQLPVQEVRQWFNNQRRKIKKEESNEYSNNNNNNNNNSSNLNKTNTPMNQYIQYPYSFDHSDSLLSTNSNSSILNTYLPPLQQQPQHQQQSQSSDQQITQQLPSQTPPSEQQQQQQQQQMQLSQSLSSSIQNQNQQQLTIQNPNIEMSSNISSTNGQTEIKNSINENKMKKGKNILPSNTNIQQQQQQQLINEKYIKTGCNSFLKELKSSSKLEKTFYFRYLIEGINKTDRKQMNKLLKENFENENISLGNNCDLSNNYGSMRPYKPSSDMTLSTETHRKRSIQAWNQLAKVFGAEEEKKGGNNYDLAMFNGLKYMFSNHRDYLTELCKVYGISTIKEEYQKQMSDQEMSDEPNDKI